jgi:hypothetical protein
MRSFARLKTQKQKENKKGVWRFVIIANDTTRPGGRSTPRAS